ncbi:hypothetical protein JMJ77_0001009, partial [Colletotrichum scovillei]
MGGLWRGLPTHGVRYSPKCPPMVARNLNRWMAFR